MQHICHNASQPCSYAQPCTVHYATMQHVCHYASQLCTMHYVPMQRVCHYASPTCSDLRCWHFTSLSLIHQPSRGGGGGEGETKDNVPLFFLSDPNPLFCYTSLQLFCRYYRTTNSSVCLFQVVHSIHFQHLHKFVYKVCLFFFLISVCLLP